MNKLEKQIEYLSWNIQNQKNMIVNLEAMSDSKERNKALELANNLLYDYECQLATRVSELDTYKEPGYFDKIVHKTSKLEGLFALNLFLWVCPIVVIGIINIESGSPLTGILFFLLLF